jgi:hypothetical protein
MAIFSLNQYFTSAPIGSPKVAPAPNLPAWSLEPVVCVVKASVFVGVLVLLFSCACTARPTTVAVSVTIATLFMLQKRSSYSQAFNDVPFRC